MNDKVKHIIAGALIALITVILVRILLDREFMYLGIPASVLAGAAKELLWDRLLGKGTCEFADFWFTVWGGLGVTVLSYFIL